MAFSTAIMDLNSLTLDALFVRLTSDGSLRALLELARREDLQDAGDVTSFAMVPASTRKKAVIAARAGGTVAGLAAVPTVIDSFGGEILVQPRARDGAQCRKGDVLVELEGPLRRLLVVERTLLNLLSRLCGVATRTACYVAAIAGTSAVICDTRKTMPGMRRMEKYAVRCGGGTLHRIGLYDAMLVKDNHVAGLDPKTMAAAVRRAAEQARERTTLDFVEVEVDSLEQLTALLELPVGIVDFVLLDNMAPATMRQAVAMRNAANPKLKLEASGGVTLETVHEVALTGVDRISVGGLTHSAPALDLGLDVL